MKGKKCSCGQYDAAGRCACGADWAFAPLYGDGKGHSGATIPHDNVSTTGGQSPSPNSPAYPGEGGENSPDVPGGGPNAGTGPLTTARMREAAGDVTLPDGWLMKTNNREWVITVPTIGTDAHNDGLRGSTKIAVNKSAFRRSGASLEQFVRDYMAAKVSGVRVEARQRSGLASLSEALDFAVRLAAAPSVTDAPPEFGGDLNPMDEDEQPAPPAPVVMSDQAGRPTVFSVLIAAVHRAFTQAGDVLFANGYMTQGERIELSGCVGDALKVLGDGMLQRAPSAASASIDAGVVAQCLEAVERRAMSESNENTLVYPTVHLNGTSKDALVDQLIAVTDALGDAQRKLDDANPNGRDYVKPSKFTIQDALAQHKRWGATLHALRNEIGTVTELIADQP